MAEKFEEVAVIMSQEKIGEGVYSMWLRTDKVAEYAKAGQFVSVYCNDGSRLHTSCRTSLCSTLSQEVRCWVQSLWLPTMLPRL